MAKELIYKTLCRYAGGVWVKIPLPADSFAVGAINDSVVYKMNYVFGLLPSSGAFASRCHYKSLPGDFLVVAPDGSLAVMKKEEYSKYFPKAQDAIPSSVKKKKDIKANEINPKQT